MWLDRLRGRLLGGAFVKTVIIVAMTPDGLIGRDGGLPWHEPADLAHFKRTTSGHAVIMGRKTFDSIRRPLPRRRNIVLTRDADWVARWRAEHETGASGSAPETALDATGSLDEATEMCRRRDEIVAFIVGGAQVFAAALPTVDELIVTWIRQPNLTGDTYFPSWDRSAWKATPIESDAGLEIVRYQR